MNDGPIWIDCEMTELDLKHDALIEAATLITGEDLSVLGEGVNVLIKPIDEQLAGMSDLAHEIRTKSGLLSAPVGGTTAEETTRTIFNYVQEPVPTVRKALLAGNTIGMDRAFLARDIPEPEAHVRYRNVDVSSLKELAWRQFPRVLYQAPIKQGNHRVLTSTQGSTGELRYYHEAMFVVPPGPTTNQVE